jgi:hypothetical protein
MTWTLPKINITIPLRSGGVLLIFWLFWKIVDEIGLTYHGFPIRDYLLYVGVAMLILENIKTDVKNE